MRLTPMVSSRRLCLVTAIAASTLLTACSTSTSSDTEAPSPPPRDAPAAVSAGWQRLPDLPLSDRYDELTAVVGDRLLVLGGENRPFSGGPLALPTLRDGAALDLGTRTWHPIAPAPWAPWGSGSHVVVGRKLLLAKNGPGPWAVYDSDTDVWSTVPAPPQRIQQPTLAAIGSRVYALDPYAQESAAPVQVLDVAAGTWSSLPRSTEKPDLDNRDLVAADDQLVVLGSDLGSDLDRRSAGKHRQAAVAEVWDGKHWTRYASEHAAGTDWQWTGDRIISTYRVTQRHSARGGSYEFRASAFDPVRHTWQQLPWLPKENAEFLGGGLLVGTGTRVVAEGYLYDDTTRTSTLIPNPSAWSNQAGVVTDSAIVVVSGVRQKPGTRAGRVTQLDITNQAWIYPLG